MAPSSRHFFALPAVAMALVACSGDPGAETPRDAAPSDRAGDPSPGTGGTSGPSAGPGGTGGRGGAPGVAGTGGGLGTGGGSADVDGGTAGTSTGGGAGTGSGGGVPVATGGVSGGVGGVTGGAGAGAASGGSGGSGVGAGGRGGSSGPTYFIGADITWVQADEARGATYSDGTRKEILRLLKDHGFNAIRLRTFVDPRAADGYDKQNGYGDLAHTIAFGKRIKAAGMFFLLDFHYSDNWADPAKQCVPIAWQGLPTIGALAAAVRTYTTDALSQLVAAGARPDMVQVGNEISPGMLMHRCDAAGLPVGSNPVSGAATNWVNLGTLLKAGVQGVKEVDPTIKIMLHTDRGGAYDASHWFITNALAQAVPFDVYGASCYTQWQGTPATWASTFTRLAAAFPRLAFVAAEYGPEQRAANDMIFNLPNQQGMGTFNWEPTRAGIWNTGHALFTANGTSYSATADLALYDQMKTAYAPRL